MMTTDEKTDQPKSNNRPVVRWQRIALTQLGIVNATVLSLATAALGFGLTQSSTVSGGELCALRGGLALLVASVVFALLCALTRLCDFRKTAKTARLVEEKPSHDPKSEKFKEIQALRWNTKKLGNKTWCFLHCQLGTFAVGAVLLVGAFFPW